MSKVPPLSKELPATQAKVYETREELKEEQNVRNKFVLDGLVSLFHRQERVKDKITDFEKITFKILK